MTDLETRLRDGLHSEVDHPDVDRFLTDVRRGVAWRRGRRASVGVALVVAAIVGGSVVLQQGDDTHTAPAPITHGPSPTESGTGRVLPKGAEVGAIDVSETLSGVFKLTTNEGCVACSSVWKRAASGSWDHLFDFQGRAAYGGRVDASFGPVEYLLMTANGRDGWAWGDRLWSTHDGGRSWSIISTGPGAHTPYGQSVATGAHTAWALRRSTGGASLWRTGLGSDDWQRVTGVPRLHDVVRFAGVLSDDRVVLQVSGEGGSGNAVVVGKPGIWQTAVLPFGVDQQVLATGDAVWTTRPITSRVFEVRRWRPAPVGTAAGVVWSNLGRVSGRGWLPLDDQRVLIGGPTPRVLDDQGLHPSGLDLGHDRMLDTSTMFDVTWLVTFGNHLYSSDGGGIGWVKVE
jgi:hypothetical protein